MPLVLTASSVITCSHGAKVTHTPTARVLVHGAPVLLLSDTNVVGGCPFNIPAIPKPSPCIQVRWTVAGSTRVLVGGTPVLTQAAVGLGTSPEQVPQGPPIANPGQVQVQAL